MPDYDKTTPGTDLLNEGSQDVEGNRARRINSLHRSVDDLVQEQNKKRLQVSTEVSSLTKQQQKMMAQLELERGDIQTDVAQGYSGVLKGLGRTIDSLATGVKNITLDTGKATTQAISQYGNAISEDISINKTNTIAMALSRATPLFGYFAAKFMETDVFKGAAGRIKDSVGSAMHEGLSKAGSSISNIFRKGKEVVKEEKERAPATVTDLENLQRSIESAPPKLQEGGFIKQGGMVEVHAAEVVTPIDKILEQIDEAKSADISKKLDKTLSLMSQNLMRLETVVVERDTKQRGVIKTFIEEFQNVRDTRKESHERRLLKAILELKVGLIGMTSRMRIAWQRTLLQHPTFRNMLMFSDIMKTAIMSPIKFLFGVRGGYVGDVRGATATSNVFLRLSNLMALTYTTLMPKIDDLVIYTKAAAEALTGEKISGSKQYTYTAFGKIKEWMTSRSTETLKESLFEKLIQKLDLDRDALKEAGVTGFGSFKRPGDILKNMHVSVENIKDRLFRDRDKPPEEHMAAKGYRAAKGKGEETWERMSAKISELKEKKGYQKAKSKVEDTWERMSDNISKLTEMKEKVRSKTEDTWERMSDNISKLTEMKEEAKNKVEDTWKRMSDNISKLTERKGYRTAKSKIEDVWERIADNISKLTGMKRDQEEREGPHSPSMAENISLTAELAVSDDKKRTKYQDIYESLQGKANKFAREHLDETIGVRKRIKKLGSKVWDIILFAGTFLKEMFMSAVGQISGLITPLLSFFGISKAGKLLKGTFGKYLSKIPFLKNFFAVKSPITGLPIKQAGGIFAQSAKGAGQGVAGGLAGQAVKKGALSKVGGFAARMGGRAAGAAAGGIIGLGMGAWDAMQAIRDPEGFMGNFLIRGLSGFLGGTETGAAGAMHGATKGAALGAAAGSIIPGLGTLLGGAIGAAAGGILGFVGGKKISEGISGTISAIKSLVTGVWDIVTFPYKMMKEGLKSAWVLLKWGFKMTLGKAWTSFKEWMEGPGWVARTMKWLTGWIGKIWEWIKMPFAWVGEKISGLFSSEVFSKVGAIVKEVIFTMMFPIHGIQRLFSFFKNQFVEKVSSLPYVGAIFKTIMGTFKDIKEGTLADKLEASLNDEKQEKTKGPKTIKVPPKTTKRLSWSEKRKLKLTKRRTVMDALGVDQMRYKYGQLYQVHDGKQWREATDEEKLLAMQVSLDTERKGRRVPVTEYEKKERARKELAVKTFEDKVKLGSEKQRRGSSKAILDAKPKKTVPTPIKVPDRIQREGKKSGKIQKLIRDTANLIGADYVRIKNDSLVAVKMPGEQWRARTEEEWFTTQKILSPYWYKAITDRKLDVLKKGPKEISIDQDKADISKFMETDVVKEGAGHEVQKKGLEKLGREMGQKMMSASNQTTNAVIQNTSMVNSSSKNNVAGGGGMQSYGAGYGKQFSTANNVASDVTRCNIK